MMSMCKPSSDANVVMLLSRAGCADEPTLMRGYDAVHPLLVAAGGEPVLWLAQSEGCGMYLCVLCGSGRLNWRELVSAWSSVVSGGVMVKRVIRAQALAYLDAFEPVDEAAVSVLPRTTALTRRSLEVSGSA
jgi:hypothetical protein